MAHMPLFHGARAAGQAGLMSTARALLAGSGLLDTLSTGDAAAAAGCSGRHEWQQQWQQQPGLQLLRHFSGTGSLLSDSQAAAAPTPAQQQQQPAPKWAKQQEELNKLLQVLLQPMARGPSWNGQLSPYLLKVNDQLLVQPSAVLLSAVRALHVIRGVLQEDGHVYVVGSDRLFRPLVKAAALGCLNPNMWFYSRPWSPGTLTNYSSHRRLFKESHQPNRRLFAAKGYRMVNPLCPSPPAAASPLPRLSWDDKWILFRSTRRPGYRQLLEELVDTENGLHTFKPSGSLRGLPRHLRLLVVLDTTRNAVALEEAFARNVPTVALVNPTSDLSRITYPVLARDSSPAFVHWFLDWAVKVANAAPGQAPEARAALLSGRGGGGRR